LSIHNSFSHWCSSSFQQCLFLWQSWASSTEKETGRR